eukprot:1158744-Pelagomonas_calceolata.AAC.14
MMTLDVIFPIKLKESPQVVEEEEEEKEGEEDPMPSRQTPSLMTLVTFLATDPPDFITDLRYNGNDVIIIEEDA